jgi:hypothetical protein
MFLNEEIQNKWKPVLEHEEFPQIKDKSRRDTTAILLENTAKALAESGSFAPQTLLGETAPTNATGSAVQNYDPILITLVRRSMPNLVAYDLCGVQPMTGPTGLIFAMRSRYANQAGDETFYNEVNTSHSTVVGGANTLGDKHVGTTPSGDVNTYNYGDAMSTTQAEALGSASNVDFAQMAFSIEKVSVVAKSRALKAEYSMELAQDLKAIHGLDAETELANILTTEILAEINREVVRTINITAVPGAQDNTAVAGTFDLDTDSNGRWSVEKFKGLHFQLEREANALAKSTRRGRGNIMICSSDVASALQMAGVLDYTPALNSNNLQIDDTGNTFAGVLNGKIRVYIDPYATGNYITIGYKGANSMDAGLFYCPYVPMQMVRAVGENTFQPKIGFKTRYGMVANPFSRGATASDGSLVANVNVYYRRFFVSNLM